MTIEVTESDIQLGKCSHFSCPIALATKRALNYKKGITVVVNSDKMTIMGKVKAVEYKLPKKAQDFVMMYDNKFKVEPFAFDIKEHYIV